MSGMLQYTLGLSTSPFLSGIQSALGGVRGLAGSLAGLAGIGSLGATFGMVATSGIKFNATLESQTVAFKTLLGSVGAAKGRMAELGKFAATTPFELPEVVDANKLLQTLTGGALATADGMRLVGDAAAASGRRFEETAMWVGRLYGGLKSGTPVGEATMRLLEMGLITGDTAKQLNTLAQSGGGASNTMAILETTFGKTKGAMLEQSKTFSGLWSTIKDGFAQFSGGVMQPVFDSLKTHFEKIAGWDWEGMGKRVGTVITGVMNANLGDLAEITNLALMAGFEKAVNFLSQGIVGVVASMPGLVAAVGPAIRASVERSTAIAAGSTSSLREWNAQRLREQGLGATADWQSKIARQERGVAQVAAEESTKATREVFEKVAKAMREGMAAAGVNAAGTVFSEKLSKTIQEMLNRSNQTTTRTNTQIPPPSTSVSGVLNRGSDTASGVNALERIGLMFFGGDRPDYTRDIAQNTAQLVRLWGQRVQRNRVTDPFEFTNEI